MCGRYVLATIPELVREEFSLIRIEWFPPRYNIAPTQPILIVRAERGERQAALVRWGLIPAWAKDPAELPLFFNARAETAAEKPAFRGPFRYRRCLVPATGFYEWRRGPGKAKQPYLFRPKGSELVAFAGLWEEWADDKGNIIDTATILTTAANAEAAPIHDRMPVVIRREDYDLWLHASDPEASAMLLRSPANDSFVATPVGPGVNNARTDDPSLVEPVAVAEPEANDPAPARQLRLF